MTNLGWMCCERRIVVAGGGTEEANGTYPAGTVYDLQKCSGTSGMGRSYTSSRALSRCPATAHKVCRYTVSPEKAWVSLLTNGAKKNVDSKDDESCYNEVVQ